jgi:hypothetical protein
MYISIQKASMAKSTDVKPGETQTQISVGTEFSLVVINT